MAKKAARPQGPDMSNVSVHLLKDAEGEVYGFKVHADNDLGRKTVQRLAKSLNLGSQDEEEDEGGE